MNNTPSSDGLKVFQIYLNDNSDQPPELLHGAIQSVQQSFRGYDYILYDHAGLRAFLANTFDHDVLRSFDKLRPYAYKADLGRYCLLYHYGGWYADISIMMKQVVGPIADSIDLICFSDLGDGVMPGRSLFDISNSLLYAKPKLAIFERAIASVVRHCREEYYGPSIYSPTGPSVLGASVAAEHPNEHHIIGHLMALTPNHQRRNLSFVLPDGQILALFKKGWMQPGEVLFGRRKGTNNYADLWAQRNIYC